MLAADTNAISLHRPLSRASAPPPRALPQAQRTPNVAARAEHMLPQIGIVVAIAVVVTHTGDTRSGYLGAESGSPGTEMAHVSVVAAAVPWRKGRMGGEKSAASILRRMGSDWRRRRPSGQPRRDPHGSCMDASHQSAAGHATTRQKMPESPTWGVTRGGGGEVAVLR